MLKSRTALVVLTTLVVVGLPLTASWEPLTRPMSPAAGAPSSRLLKLRAGVFDPAVAPAGEGLRRQPPVWRSLPHGDDLYIVQGHGPLDASARRDLQGQGLTFFDYLPDQAWLARVPASGVNRLRMDPRVRSLTPYLPGYRVDPALMATTGAVEDGPLHLLMEFAPDRDARQMLQRVRALSPSVRAQAAGRHGGAIMVDLFLQRDRAAAILPRLARVPDLLWIEERQRLTLRNQAMKGVMQTGTQGDTRLFDAGLTGTGEVIAAADSGVDVNHCFFTDPNQAVAFELIDSTAPPAVPATNSAHRKVLAYQYHAGSDMLDDDGHGTHVSGTAVGDNIANPASGSDPGFNLNDGMAPAAQLVFQDIDRQGGPGLDLPSNLHGYVQAAYNAGARIHTNSWGSSTSSYTNQASQFDRFTWENPDMLVLVAMGNSGPGSGSIGSPATAKNIIAVGMTETPASGDPDNLESGSSNGPTSDGRLKPDVVNVGGFPIRSAAAGTTCGIVNYGGTSMSTPGVAGAAAQVRQYLAQGYYPHGYPGSGPAVLPSAALLKGLIVNAGVNMTGSNVDAPIPDNSQGWGRLLLDQSLYLAGDDLRLLILHDDDLDSGTDGFSAGATIADTYTLHQCRTDVPLRITLTWSDPPVASTSGQAWVNDLNLEVAAPDGSTVYRGNVFSGGVSTTGGSADDRNNVEQVLLPAGIVQSGLYTIRVVPGSVNTGPQPYALLATGDVSATASANLTLGAPVVSGGNDDDAFLDQHETVNISYSVQNSGCGDAGSLTAVLEADPAWPVTVTPASRALGPLAAGAGDPIAFQVHLAEAPGACGGSLPLSLQVEDGDGRRWLQSASVALDLDPGSGNRFELDDVESGDQSSSAAADWSIQGCATSSGATAWHLGDTDCSGIPQDASAHILQFDINLAQGEQLSALSFNHAFDGYSNASNTDSVHVEIDHDGDGNWHTIASWTDAEAPKSMSGSGSLDLSAFNSGLVTTPGLRFRFQSGANWVGGPNNASGWDVDDIRIDIDVVGVCETCTSPPPGEVGNSLVVNPGSGQTDFSWGLVTGAAGYQIRRAASPDMLNADRFDLTTPSWSDTSVPAANAVLYYQALALNACGNASSN